MAARTATRARTTEHALLGMLSLGPGSGYDLKKRIDGSIANFWKESFGQIYPMLAHLARRGLVARRVQRQQGKPDRHVYSLTAAGEAELRRWLGEPPRSEPFRSELLLKLFLGARAPAHAIEHLRAFRRRQEHLLAHYAAVEARLARSRHADTAYPLATLRFGQYRARALQAWADETIATLERLARPRRAPSKNGGAP